MERFKMFSCPQTHLKSFFSFTEYLLHNSPSIFDFEGRGSLGRVESGNNRVCTMRKDKVGFSTVSLACPLPGTSCDSCNNPISPQQKNIVCPAVTCEQQTYFRLSLLSLQKMKYVCSSQASPAVISQSLKNYKSERRKALSF